jgi:hypothetical protein
MNCFKKKDYKKQEDEDKKSPGTQFTFYDQYGILRKGVATDDGLLHNRDEELDRILKLENSISTLSDEDKRTWYIVESGWIRTWLSYVRYGTSSLGESLSSPAPSAINNECLLLMTANTELNEVDGFPAFTWVVKNGLLPAGKDGQGHFRRVNCKVWEAFCDMYKDSGPAIKYVEEEPKVVEPLPETPEAKGEEGKTEESKAGADKKKEAPAAAKKEEDKKEGTAKKEGVDGDAKPEEDAEPEIIMEDPTRWHDSSLWVIDQDQERFRRKFDEKRLPHKSKEQRVTAMKDCWNSKKLRSEAKAAEEAEEAALAALEDKKDEGEEAKKEVEEEGEEEEGDEGEEEETKKDNDEEEGKEDATKEDNGNVNEEEEEHPEGYVEDLLSPVASERTLIAHAESADYPTESTDLLGQLPESSSFNDTGNPDLRKQSVHVGMDDIFMRAPSQEALEATSRMAQARTEALRNAKIIKPEDVTEETPVATE